MKKIIVATDFSPASLNAATYAVAMAETTKHCIMPEQLVHKSHSKQMVLYSHVPVMELSKWRNMI